MKDYRYANRGMTLEQLIRHSNMRYREAGVAVIEKQATEFIPIRDGRGRVVSCKIVGQSSVDFIGRVGSMPIAIESKHTSSDSIRWDAVQEHQGDFLTRFSEGGQGIGIVLVSFKLERFFAVPWAFWETARTAWIETPKTKVTVEFEGVTWTTNGKASMKPSDLLPEWEIPFGGLNGLDYLAGIKLKHR